VEWGIWKLENGRKRLGILYSGERRAAAPKIFPPFRVGAPESNRARRHGHATCSVAWWLMAGAGSLREKSTAGWFVVREKYCWLVVDKPSEQGDGSEMGRPRRQRGDEVSSFFSDGLPRWILVFFILYYITLSILFWIKKYTSP
jgi:hypothetical protein